MAAAGKSAVVDEAAPAGRATRFQDSSVNAEQPRQLQGRAGAAQKLRGSVLSRFIEHCGIAVEHRGAVPAADLRRGARRGQTAELLGTEGINLQRRLRR